MEQPKLNRLDHLVQTVADIDATVHFFTSILGMAHAPFLVADGSTPHGLALKRSIAYTGCRVGARRARQRPARPICAF